MPRASFVGPVSFEQRETYVTPFYFDQSLLAPALVFSKAGVFLSRLTQTVLPL